MAEWELTRRKATTTVRFPRLAQAAAFVALATAPIAAISLPALAGSPRQLVAARLADLTRSAIHNPDSKPPHARPASSGALPRHQPVTPSVPSEESVIAGDLVRDAAISAGVLVCLLIPITIYGSASRRRERLQAQAAAERERQPRTRTDYDLDDPLLEYFGPQHARPAGLTAGQRTAMSPRYQPRPVLTGRSTLSPAFAARPMLAAPPPAAGQAAGPRLAVAGSPAGSPGLAGTAEPPRTAAARSGRDPSAAAEPDAWTGAEARFPPPEQMPAGSPNALRHVPVAGAPPWEPAPRPTSELPWAVIPGPQVGAARHRRPVEARPATASAAPRSLFEPDPAEYAPEAGSDRGRRTDSSGHAIYTWNPGAAG
jgi:hypothetical protein